MKKINDNYQVYQLRIAYQLEVDHDYVPILIKGNNHGLWFANFKAKNYPLIKLSSLYTDDHKTNKQNIEITDKVGKLMGKKIEYIELACHVEGLEELPENVYDISDGVDDKILDSFPDFIQIYLDCENPEEELKEINENLKRFRSEKTKEKLKKLKLPSVTMVIIGICSLVFLASLFVGGSDKVAVAINLGALYTAFVDGMGEYWRFLTAGFVHITVFHFLMNMYALYNLGIFLENIVGKFNYAITLIMGIIFGSWLAYLTGVNTVTLGISGGLYALFALLIVYFIKTGLIKNPMMYRQVYMLIALNVIISFSPNISLFGHLGGAIAGGLIGIVIFYKHNKSLFLNTAIACGLIVGLMAVRTMEPKPLDTVYYGTDIKVIENYRAWGLDDYADHIETSMNKFYLEQE